MTASEAREAHRIITLLADSESDAIDAGEAEDPPASRLYIEAMQRAALALDAYADGIDAASLEREAIRTAIEHMRDGGPNSDSEAYVYGAVLSIIDARGAK